ncbi:putative immunity protein [Lacticaseibacillus zhaodongensis]|uniref:putative immunity protein n=1 Tax=Lacticaseibacillus zhaodongensis TaxID=2668065 RepID=UPI0012D36BF4|nr:hypothetical protein [Lacticaseibacillus zhaodongensis]
MMAKYRAAAAPQAKAFYRFCHQASLTPHVKRHALIAADFAMAVIAFGQAEPLVAARTERQWQLAAPKTVCTGN